MSEHEEVKELGEVNCPLCNALITVKKKVCYNQALPRRKVSEELFAEKSVQTTLPREEK